MDPELVYDLTHVLHVVPAVVAYAILGTALLWRVADRLDLSTDGRDTATLRWSLRLLFLGAGALQLCGFLLVLTYPTSGWRHLVWHVTGLPQAIGGPVAVHAILRSVRSATEDG